MNKIFTVLGSLMIHATSKVKKSFAFTVILSVLLSGCQKDASVSNGETSPAAAPVGTASPVVQTSVSLEATAATEASIAFKEREPDRTEENITELIRSYQRELVHAINTNTFSYVEPYIIPGSSLYQAQKELVASLYARKIKEHFVDSEVYNFTYDQDRYKVEVTEQVGVGVAEKGEKINNYQWIYTVEPSGGKLKLSGLEVWKTYEKDMKQRNAGAKANGYYARELMQSYSALLESSVNTLDITDLKHISSNETVLERQKELICKLRSFGKDYTIQASIESEDTESEDYILEFRYRYKDFEGREQTGSEKLFFQLGEIRKHYRGRAVIEYISGTDSLPALQDAGGTVRYKILRMHPSMPEYLLRIYARPDEVGRQNGRYVTEQMDLLLVDPTGEKVLQRIPVEQAYTWGKSGVNPVVEDMNFDGYEDIRIQNGTPAGRNIPYLYWLWDQGTASFVPNKDLEEIVSPVFNPVSRTIETMERVGAGAYWEGTYQYKNGRPVLIKKVERVVDPEKKVWVISLSEEIGGQMKMKKQYEEPLMDE
ncbi:XAC2610-related protein [Gorillibacterium sp. sgz5001074]|uniref:XAC2610-related protein n=1 Tax=Gorillibacterium sp. sgz5001074 TaxID=3446695 RepID=UPI003F681A11